MRISDWSSDVCSSDLRDILDPFDEHRIRVAVDMRDDRAARGVARTGQTERNTRIDDGDDAAAQRGEPADTRVGKRAGRDDADTDHRFDLIGDDPDRAAADLRPEEPAVHARASRRRAASPPTNPA